MYKIISKVLANILIIFLPNCLSEEQSAFVEGHSIIDNVLVTIETIHHMKYKVKGKVGEFSLKIDISKAFEKFSWKYLFAILKKLGFNDI